MSWVYDAAWMMGLRCYARLRGITVQSDHSDTNEPRGNNGNGDVLLRLEELNASQLQTALVIANSPTNCRRVAARKRNQSIKYNQVNDVPDDDDTIQLESALAIVNSPSNFLLTPRVAARKRKQSTKYDEFNSFSDDDDESKSTEIQDDHDMDWSNDDSDEKKHYIQSPCPTDDASVSGEPSLDDTNNAYMLPSRRVSLIVSGFIGQHIDFHVDVFHIIRRYLWNGNIFPSRRVFVMTGTNNKWVNQLRCVDLSEKKPFNVINISISQDQRIYRPNFVYAGSPSMKCNFNDPNRPRTFQMKGDPCTEDIGLCYVPNINCSTLLSTKTQNKLNITSGCQHNAIFKCGGRVRGQWGRNYTCHKVSMIICKEGAMDAHAHEIQLPRIPRLYDTHFCQFAGSVFSHQHGLITIYGKQVLVLDIVNYSEESGDVRWEYIDNPACLIEETGPEFIAPPICTLIDNGFDDELFICSQSSVECYNFSAEQWKVLQNMNNCSVKVSHSGIHYDGMNNRVFVGGGLSTPRSVSYYDVCTDEWKNLPDTNRDHKNQCTIWSANNIVYIAGNDGKSLGVVECIDLSEKAPKWLKAPREMQLYSYVDYSTCVGYSTGRYDEQVQINGMFC